MATASTPALDPTSADLAGRVIGGCRLDHLLGVGGMGAVWRAHHLALDVPVALKLMLPIKDLDPNASERLLREARAAARLRHPHIVGVLNVGEEAGLRFLVMELIEGQSLQKLLDQRGALPVHEAVGLVLQILDALELTFEHRFVHRDIKPDNILIDERGVAKLADLGLAKQTGSELNLTQTGVVMGSPYYLAPEQAMNAKAVDPRADLYALGCVLCHLLTGAPPYTGATHLEVIVKHISSPLPDLARAEPRLPQGLDAVVLRMLAKSPAERYQTPQEVGAALAQFVTAAEGRVPVARSSWSRHRRWLLAIGALALLSPLGFALLRSGREATPAPGSSTTVTTATAVTPAQAKEPPRPPPQRRRGEAKRTRSRPADEALPAVPEAMPRRVRGQLAEALANHDTHRLQQLLDRGTPPNVGDGVTSPLHRAVAMGRPQYVRMLLEKGANPNARDAAGETPLHQALRHVDRTSVSALLDFGANPNLRDRTGRTPLELANGDQFMVQKLLEKGAHP